MAPGGRAAASLDLLGTRGTWAAEKGGDNPGITGLWKHPALLEPVLISSYSPLLLGSQGRNLKNHITVKSKEKPGLDTSLVWAFSRLLLFIFV